MTNIPDSGEYVVAVDSMAALNHLNLLADTMNKASSFINPVYDYLRKQGKRNLTDEDALKMAKLFISQIGDKARMLDQQALEHYVSDLIVREIIVGKQVSQAFQHLYGLGIALQLKPVPRATHDVFFVNREAEA